MPIYEYQCMTCGEEFTALRRITDETLPPCPRCTTGAVQKKISLSAFHLKGTGWYKTDYARNSTSGGKGHHKAGEAEAPAPTGADAGAKAPDSASTPAPTTTPAKAAEKPAG